jgi:hypothetical protein
MTISVPDLIERRFALHKSSHGRRERCLVLI